MRNTRRNGNVEAHWTAIGREPWLDSSSHVILSRPITVTAPRYANWPAFLGKTSANFYHSLNSRQFFWTEKPWLEIRSKFLAMLHYIRWKMSNCTFATSAILRIVTKSYTVLHNRIDSQRYYNISRTMAVKCQLVHGLCAKSVKSWRKSFSWNVAITGEQLKPSPMRAFGRYCGCDASLNF